jgi:hypothetical protein
VAVDHLTPLTAHPRQCLVVWCRSCWPTARCSRPGYNFANEPITGYNGPTSFEIALSSHFHQSGLVRLTEGSQGTTLYVVGITLEQLSEWTVYPCSGAGLELSDTRNGTDFQVGQLSTFRDCRGSGAKQHYPEPHTYCSADGSCSPCTCTAAPFNACPDGEAPAGACTTTTSSWLAGAPLPPSSAVTQTPDFRVRPKWPFFAALP